MDPLYVAYHNTEWGVPGTTTARSSNSSFWRGLRRGLSWITILRKREAYGKAFDDVDPERVARYDARKLSALLRNQGIVRNRQKIAATLANARVP